MTKTVKISGEKFTLSSDEVARVARNLLPEPVREHFVVIDGRRFPPKQVISLVTGLDRADFTTHQARSVLRRLGFVAARRPAPARAAEAMRETVEAVKGTDPTANLRPFVGKWVAVRDDEVLVAADEPTRVISWLSEHGEVADSTFRVPAGEVEGAAPA